MNATRIDGPGPPSQKRRQVRLLIAGLTGMVGGEAFCILGPLGYPHFVHVVCHAVFYAGILLCAAAAVLHWRTK
jgi:hypothetical protein